jgi:hypothetical protein
LVDFSNINDTTAGACFDLPRLIPLIGQFHFMPEPTTLVTTLRLPLTLALTQN